MKNGKEISSEEESIEQVEKKKSEEKKEKKLLNKKREKVKENPKDKTKKNEDIIKGENDIKFILDNKKRISVHKFKGKLYVDFREFYEDNGEMKPGKKGISLTVENWEKLKGFIDDIDESIDNMK